MYAFGYSKGGFAAWYVTLYFADRFAGTVSLAAGFDVAPGPTASGRSSCPTSPTCPCSTRGAIATRSSSATSRRSPPAPLPSRTGGSRRRVAGWALPITNIEVAGGVHNQLTPPGEAIVDILNRRRAVDPPRVAHVFRHLHQASSYWIEGLTWVGDSWGEPWPARLPATPGESEASVLARTLEPLLGRLTGVREGQVIRVTRRHIGDIVIWFGERSVNWDQPVSVECDGKLVFSGKLAQDVEVALARAKATMDFERLVFAGIRVSASGEASVVTAATMPQPAWTR